jgi:hypothetical protein
MPYPPEEPVTEPSPSTSAPTMPTISLELLQFLSQHVPQDSYWTEGVDNPQDTTDEPGSGSYDTEPDIQSLREGLALIQKMEANLSAWPKSIWSWVLMDIWHAMAHIKVAKEHGFHQPFAQALHDAILISDKEDKKWISSYLTSIRSSWDNVLQFQAQWLWKWCKWVIPPPEFLYPLIKEVYSVFGPLLDSTTKKPLFNAQAWKDTGNVLKAMQAGLLSDPPGIPLYYQVSIDKKHGDLPLYQCIWGMNHVEGGGASFRPETSSYCRCFCSPYLHKGWWFCINAQSHCEWFWNCSECALTCTHKVGALNHCDIAYKGHFDVWLTNHLQRLLDETWHHIPDSQALMGWVNGDLYSLTNEIIRIVPVPDSIWVTADIEGYQHNLNCKNKHLYLVRQQKTKFAVFSIHTTSEKQLFKKLIQENPAFNQTNASLDWKQGAKVWNRGANRQGKVCVSWLEN